MGIVNALFRNGQDAFVGEEELLDRAIACCVRAVRGVTLKMGSVK